MASPQEAITIDDDDDVVDAQPATTVTSSTAPAVKREAQVDDDEDDMEQLLALEEELEQERAITTPSKRQKVDNDANGTGSAITSTPASAVSTTSSQPSIEDDDVAQQMLLAELAAEDDAKQQHDNTAKENAIHCVECDSQRYNVPFYHAFNIAVCNSCQREHTQKYQLISRTKVKEEYLLTDKELNTLLYLNKPNPHKPSYSAMKLYRKSQVEAIAFSHFDDEEGLQAERQRREHSRVIKEEKQRKRAKRKEEAEAKAEAFAAEYVPPTLAFKSGVQVDYEEL